MFEKPYGSVQKIPPSAAQLFLIVYCIWKKGIHHMHRGLICNSCKLQKIQFWKVRVSFMSCSTVWMEVIFSWNTIHIHSITKSFLNHSTHFCFVKELIGSTSRLNWLQLIILGDKKTYIKENLHETSVRVCIPDFQWNMCASYSRLNWSLIDYDCVCKNTHGEFGEHMVLLRTK